MIKIMDYYFGNFGFTVAIGAFGARIRKPPEMLEVYKTGFYHLFTLYSFALY
jgi:hypothetical protein